MGVCVQALGVFPAREVVLLPPRNEDVVAGRFEACHQVRPEKSTASRYERAAHFDSARARVIQSTRPTHRSRFSAYQRIVRRTPSSHETFGTQPVSSLSFS